MVDLIAQYRQDVENVLRGQLAPFEAQTIADEIETHLRERCAASIELGASPETAQLEALAAMGPSTALAQEFMAQKPVSRLLEPKTANWILLATFAVPVLAERAFATSQPLNLLTIAAWFGIPAFSRKWPIWGVLGGVAMIEFLLVLPNGRGNGPADLLGIGTVVGGTLLTYAFGRLCRDVSQRIKKRNRRTMA